MKKMLMKNNRGQLGMDTAKMFILGLMSLLVIGVTILIVLSSLGSTSAIANNNDSLSVIGNGTAGINSFFSNTGTWLALLGVVVIILIISVVVAVVNRFGR